MEKGKSNKVKTISWLAKLSPEQVRLIRQLAAEGLSQAKIGQQFQVSQSTVHAILTGKVYKSVA